MRFSELNASLPYVTGGKLKILEYKPYACITLAFPGRHEKQTDPEGGDFVVKITDPALNWVDYEFTHSDIFRAVEKKKSVGNLPDLMKQYLEVVKNDGYPALTEDVYQVDIHDTTFLQAVQCLAVAEHRRYHQHEKRWGGRYLPFRFAAGIAEGLWEPLDAATLQRRGRIGVEILEKAHGKPKLTEELMK